MMKKSTMRTMPSQQGRFVVTTIVVVVVVVVGRRSHIGIILYNIIGCCHQGGRNRDVLYLYKYCMDGWMDGWDNKMCRRYTVTPQTPNMLPTTFNNFKLRQRL
jgi:hypothetical protein